MKSFYKPQRSPWMVEHSISPALWRRVGGRPTAALTVFPPPRLPEVLRSKVTEACWHESLTRLGLLPGPLPTSHPPSLPGLHDMCALPKKFCLSTWGRGEPYTPLPIFHPKPLYPPPLQRFKTKVSLNHLQFYSRAEISHFLTINIKK